MPLITRNSICRQSGANMALTRQIYFLSEGVSCGLDKEIALDGTYLKYFPFRAMIERSQMTPYHKKLCDKSLVRCCIKQAINLSGVRHLNLYQPTLAIWILVNE